MLQVIVNNEESDESFESSWSYMQDIQSSALWGHDRRKFHKEVTESKVMTHIHLILFLPAFKLHHLLVFVSQMTSGHMSASGLQIDYLKE